MTVAVGFRVFMMSFVTLSFLVTTPEYRVPPQGGLEPGFPRLSALRRKAAGPRPVARRSESQVGG